MELKEGRKKKEIKEEEGIKEVNEGRKEEEK